MEYVREKPAIVALVMQIVLYAMFVSQLLNAIPWLVATFFWIVVTVTSLVLGIYAMIKGKNPVIAGIVVLLGLILAYNFVVIIFLSLA